MAHTPKNVNNIPDDVEMIADIENGQCGNDEDDKRTFLFSTKRTNHRPGWLVAVRVHGGQWGVSAAESNKQQGNSK